MPGNGRPLLAIDTSTEMAGIALLDGMWVSELVWDAGRNQTATLLPQVRHLLAVNDVAPRALTAVVVAIGPGTFNGLRVGLSVAKGLSYGLGVPIIGVGTLDVVAYPFSRDHAPIRAFVPAGRGRVVFADYRHRNGRWVRSTDLRNARFDELTTALTERTLLVGECPGEVAERLAVHTLVDLPSPALRLRRPAYLAELGYRRLQASSTDRLETLEPIYVHATTASPADEAGTAARTRE